jgi:hypothetical protein
VKDRTVGSAADDDHRLDRFAFEELLNLGAQEFVRSRGNDGIAGPRGDLGENVRLCGKREDAVGDYHGIASPSVEQAPDPWNRGSAAWPTSGSAVLL